MSSLLRAAVDQHAPNTWDSMYDIHSTKCISISQYDSDYRTAKQLLQASLNVEPTDIKRVQNAHLWGCYLLKREEYKSKRSGGAVEKQLWHATSVANAANIVETNLDWRRSRRTKFGEGVSFSPDAEYANTQSNLENGTHRALILARVLVGNTCEGSSSMSIPSGTADTSVGNSNRVYVKYYDNEFYPEFVVYYDSPPIDRFRRRRYY